MTHHLRFAHPLCIIHHSTDGQVLPGYRPFGQFDGFFGLGFLIKWPLAAVFNFPDCDANAFANAEEN